MGYLPYQLVQDFFRQQYLCGVFWMQMEAHPTWRMGPHLVYKWLGKGVYQAIYKCPNPT